MITTGLPQEYVPNGRKHYENQHPGEKFLCQSALQHRSVEAFPQNIVTSMNKVTIEDQFSENEKWIIRMKNDCEEELYINNHSVIWSIGINDENSQIKKCFTIDSPVKQALWGTFQMDSTEHPKPSSQDEKQGARNCVCILDSNNINVYEDTGQHYLSPLPFQLNRVWKMKNGLILERVVTENERILMKKHGDHLPVIFSMRHPLDEVAPVVIKTPSITSSLTSQISYINVHKQNLLYISPSDLSLAVTYDFETGQHSVWKIRNAMPGECVANAADDSIHGGSFLGSPSCTNVVPASSSLYSRLLISGTNSPSGISSFSPLRNYTNSSKLYSPTMNTVNSPSGNNLTNMAAISRSISPSISSGNLYRLSAMSPICSRASPQQQRNIKYPSISNSADGGSFVLQSLSEIQEPLTPDICLDFLWSEPVCTVGAVQNQATTVFITVDFINQSYLCFLISDQSILRCVRFEKSNDEKLLIFGAVTNIPAKEAISLENYMIVMDPAFNLLLYSGITNICHIYIPNLPVPSIESMASSFINHPGNSSLIGTPRRSSMITSSRPTSAMDARFDDNLQMLSPVPTEMEDSVDSQNSFCNNHNISSAGNIIAFRDGVKNRVTIETATGNLFRIFIPAVSSSFIVRAVLKSLQSILPRDLILSLYSKWYTARNAPGSTFVSSAQEWNLFLSCIFTLMGYNVENLIFSKLLSSFDSSVVSIEAKRFKVSDSGDDEDWRYLMHSSYHNMVTNRRKNLLSNSSLNETSPLSSDLDSCINQSASLFTHIPAIFYVLHLKYEDMKLNSSLWQTDLQLLATLLIQLAIDLKLDNYVDYYCRDFPDLCHYFSGKYKHQINEVQLSLLQYPSYFSTKPPSIFNWIYSSFAEYKLSPYPHIPDVNTTSRNMILVVGILNNCGELNIQDFINRISSLSQCKTNWAVVNDTLRRINISQLAINEKIIFLLSELGMKKQDIDCLPYGISLPIVNAIYATRENPPSEWSGEAFSLIEREDLANLKKTSKNVMQLKRSKKSTNNFGLNTKKSLKQEEETGMEHLDYEVLSLRFSQDLRVKEVCQLLQSSRPVPITIQQRPEVSDHDFIEEQERQLYSLCIRTMALPIGRGMFTLRSSNPVITEPLPIPKLCLTGKATPRNTTVDLSHIDAPANMNVWPLFHNGVAAGLKINARLSQIDSTWIVYNAPKNSNDTPIEHAGFLMALGLNGNLSNLAYLNMLNYLTKGHELTTVGLLLGVAAANRGTMDMACTKLFSIHVEAFLPPTSVELNLPQLVQVAAVLSMGLVYEGTAHRPTAEVLLSEIGRPPGPEGENCVDRESYSVASGLALGLVTFGKGSEIVGLSDLNAADMLHHYMVGGRRRTLNGFSKEKYKSPSYQIKEGDSVNVDVTSPGATIALGMMFFKTGNMSVANWMIAPDTQILLDSIRPDFLLLRTFSHGLIMWNDIYPSNMWVESHLSEIIAKYAFKRVQSPNEDIDYESMSQAYCNIIAGACLVLGLKFAGTANDAAFQTIMKYLKRFIQISLLSAVDLAGKMTIETCLNTTVLALASVMAGTGDLEVLRICRYLRSRIGQSSTCVLYGSHMVSHMAIGLLFLGGGRFSLGTDDSDIAALICAFFPKFPIHSNDNRYHLQAFRHLYVLAVKPMLLVPRDIDSGNATYANISIEFKDTDFYNNIKCSMKAPCIIPNFDLLSKVIIEDDRYWRVVFDEHKNWDSLRNLLNGDGSLFLKQKAGCLSYSEDPKGYKTLLTQGIIKDTSSAWTIKAETIKAFTSDTHVLNFAKYILHPSSNNKKEEKTLHILQNILYECVTKERTQILPIYMDMIFSINKLSSHELSALELWQMKLSLSFFKKLSSQAFIINSKSLINPEFMLAMKSQVEGILEHWLQDNGELVTNYLMKDIHKYSQLLNCCLTFYNFPYQSEFSGINFGDEKTLFSSLKRIGLNARSIFYIKKHLQKS